MTSAIRPKKEKEGERWKEEEGRREKEEGRGKEKGVGTFLL